MSLHAQFAKTAIIVSVLARVRHVDQVVFKSGGKLSAHCALVHAGRGITEHRTGLHVVAALTPHTARPELTHRAPGDDAVTLFSAVITVIAHGARCVLRQCEFIVEQDQRVFWRVLS